MPSYIIIHIIVITIISQYGSKRRFDSSKVLLLFFPSLCLLFLITKRALEKNCFDLHFLTHSSTNITGM